MLRRLHPLALLMIIIVFSSTASVAFAQENRSTVHGTIYDLWTFTPLENVTIEVYSDSTLRLQTLVPDGAYSLSLHPDNYTIKARQYSGSTLLYDTEENITLEESDNLLLDMMMFPTFEENELPENYETPLIESGEEGKIGLSWLELAAVLIIVIAGVIVIYHQKILKSGKKGVAKPPARTISLPEDLKKVLDVIRRSSGRITQVNLREKLPHSEAKVSLMISDLEDRGLIRKIKKGRGNVIVLKKDQHST